jgi:hypothetical protein
MAADTPDAMGREMRRSAAEPDDHRPLWFRAKMDAIARQIAGRERGMIQSVINRRARKRQADEMERARRERFDRSVRGVIAAKHDLEDTKEHPPKGNPQ